MGDTLTSRSAQLRARDALLYEWLTALYLLQASQAHQGRRKGRPLTACMNTAPADAV